MSRRGRHSDYYEDIYERDRYSNCSRRERDFEDDVDYRRRPRAGLVREIDERIHVRDRSSPDFCWGPTKDEGVMVERPREPEDVEFRSWERPRRVERESEEVFIRRGSLPLEERPRRKVNREEILIRDENRGRRPSEWDEIEFKKREQSLPPREKVFWEEEERTGKRLSDRDMERDEVVVRRRDRSRPAREVYERDEVVRKGRRGSSSPDSDDKRDEVVFRRSRRDSSREREWERDKFHRYSSPRARSQSRYRPDEREEIIVRRDERDRRRSRGDIEREEIIFRKREEISSPESASSESSPDPPPPIHQVGYKVIRPRSRRNTFDEVEIRPRGERKGQFYENDLIDRREKDIEESPSPPRRRYSPQSEREDEAISHTTSRPQERKRERELVIRERERGRRSTLDERDARDIQDYYARRDAEREEFLPDQDGRIGRRYTGTKGKRDRPWTEITKDLVVREAIERAGYEYEETDDFYYIFDYLRYDDVAMLVDLTERIRRARHERIHEINRERATMPPLHTIPPPPLPPAPRPPVRILEKPPLPDPYSWEEERIRERPVMIEERRPPQW
ncbi:hypothetical protein VTN77DRAFT_2803 [Rasamsonia byssochlamydoides]|uniref:uncharacterized protein n=1 Tax=Rasamsonia byssochlamydoides TaxID=89139 RepID=UPI003743201B